MLFFAVITVVRILDTRAMNYHLICTQLLEFLLVGESGNTPLAPVDCGAPVLQFKIRWELFSDIIDAYYLIYSVFNAIDYCLLPNHP